MSKRARGQGYGSNITMQVSDEEGMDWKGTKIHENLQLKKMACGKLNCCGNTAGLNKEGDEGSNFIVGRSGKNTFIDTHMFMGRPKELIAGDERKGLRRRV